MLFSSRVIMLATAFAVSASASLVSRQNQNQGQPISAGRPANHSADASGIFGTTTDSVNWQKTPTGLCIVPEYQNEVGLSNKQDPLTVQQAMDLCPRAQRIVVHHD